MKNKRNKSKSAIISSHRGANFNLIFFREHSSMKLLYMISQIFCQLHAKLNFGIFCYSLRWLKKVSTFCLKVIFFIAIASKKQKQIDYKSVDRDDPSSIFCLYVVKFGPNVNLANFPRFRAKNLANLAIDWSKIGDFGQKISGNTVKIKMSTQSVDNKLIWWKIRDKNFCSVS